MSKRKALLSEAEIDRFGVHYDGEPFEPIDEKIVTLVRPWIVEYCTVSSGFRGGAGSPGSSYAWKHVVEELRDVGLSDRFVPPKPLGIYVPNGVFIVAALREGYQAIRCAGLSCNALLNMRFWRVTEYEQRLNPSTVQNKKQQGTRAE